MSEWKEYKIKNITKRITSGGTPSTKIREYYGGEIPWLNTKEIGFNHITDTEVKITEAGLNNSSAKWIEPNSVIVAMYGATAGKIAINKIPLTTNQACCNLTINGEIADYNFVYYYLCNSYDELKVLASGAAQQNLNVSIISDFIIFLPPLPEQRAIASVLSSLDDKIDLLHRENKTLEAMAETLFQQWFIEEAKDEWETGKLGDFITVKGGTTPSTKNPEFWNGTIHWTSPRDLSNHTSVYLLDTERKITEKGLSEIGSGLLPKGAVLLSSRAPIGYLAITEVPMAINQGYIGIVCDKLLSNYFMYLWIRLNLETIKSSAHGSVFPEIPKSTFRELDIDVPPKEKLQIFNNEVAPLFEKIKLNMYQIRTLEKLRDTLLPKLMSGEVRVKYEEEEMASCRR